MWVHLASSSPRRKALLEQAGFAVDLCAPPSEPTWEPGESPEAFTERCALAKLTAARAAMGPTLQAPLLAADTVVWQHDVPEPFGKPIDEGDARRMLQRLSGSQHAVTTGYACIWPDARVHVAHHTTHVWFRALLPSEWAPYLASREWTDKAGGYGIQGLAGSWVTRMEGSYTNVVGLPLAQIVMLLAESP